MARHVAASAFGHCLALVRDEEAAAHLAIVAARRGGRSLWAVLGHARHQALAYVAANPPPPPDLPTDAGPCEVAWALAGCRPPGELAVVDLSGRYGLSRAGLGLALRLAPSAAAARVADAARTWDAELDPALLAWLGPGECEGLAAVLDGRVTPALAELLELGIEVRAHTDDCAACSDRQRAMASVRLVVTSTPLPAPPPTVVAAVSGSRLQPSLLPPPLDRRRRRAGPRTGVAVGAVLAVTVVGVVIGAVRGQEEAGRESVEALTRLPVAGAALQVVPATLDLSAGEVVLVNAAGRTIAWEATTDAPWLEVVPSRGRLAAGQRRPLRVRSLGTAPEGEVRAAVRVSGDDGSAAAAVLSGTVEHPPELGATADGCRVTAVSEDEGEVVVTLHWLDRSGNQTTAPMTPAGGGVVGSLPPGDGPLTWWVAGVDGRGNQARTADVAVPTGC